MQVFFNTLLQHSSSFSATKFQTVVSKQTYAPLYKGTRRPNSMRHIILPCTAAHIHSSSVISTTTTQKLTSPSIFPARLSSWCTLSGTILKHYRTQFLAGISNSYLLILCNLTALRESQPTLREPRIPLLCSLPYVQLHYSGYRTEIHRQSPSLSLYSSLLSWSS